MHKQMRVALLAAATTLLLAVPALAQQKMEVIHWMNGEAAANKLKVVAEALKAQGIEWVDNSIPDPEAARTLIVSRILAGDAPAVAMYNSGGPLAEVARQGILRPLDDLAKEMDWEHIVSPAMWEAMNVDGHVYSVPFNMQALNWLWYNKAMFTEAGLDPENPPKTWDDVLAVSKIFESKGKIGLVASKENWPVIHMFGSVIANVAGPEIYRAIYTDHSVEAVKSPELLKAATTFVAIRDGVDPGSNGRSWIDAQNLMFEGKAAMQHMGDWFKGGVLIAGLTPGKEIGCMVGPGMGIYFADASSFVMPMTTDPEIIKIQDAFARTVMSKEVQIATAKVDSGTPARLDVDPSSLDICAQAGIKAMLSPETSVPGDTWASDGFDYDGALFDVSAEIWGNKALGPQDMVNLILEVVERFPKKG